MTKEKIRRGKNLPTKRISRTFCYLQSTEYEVELRLKKNFVFDFQSGETKYHNSISLNISEKKYQTGKSQNEEVRNENLQTNSKET